MTHEHKATDASLEHVDRALRSEAELHWQRNNYFLVAASILLLTYSQFRGSLNVEAAIAIMGCAISTAWLLITHRSDAYIQYWKIQTRTLGLELGYPDIYPVRMAGIDMQKLIFISPGAFLILWMFLAVTMAGALVPFAELFHVP